MSRLKMTHKQILTTIREWVRSELKPLRLCIRGMRSPRNYGFNSFCESMKMITVTCNEKMLDFAQQVVEDAVNIVGTPPCAFTVAAKGSLAQGEATPYSDIEFFFIIETKTAETKQYFMNLAMNIYFLIGNLQETKLKYMNISELKDWFEDGEMNGVKIDGLQRGAGNIPTGNGETDRKNKYINSEEEFSEKFKMVFANPDPEEAIQGDDSAMLAFTSEIYSYQRNFLDDFVRKQKQIRMNLSRQQITEDMLENDIAEYELDIATFVEDNVVEVKPKIYRYPSLIILDLSILYQIHASSSWDALEQLSRTGNISPSIKQALHNLLATASYIRMCTYLFHKSQNENMVLPTIPPTQRKRNTGIKGACYLPSYYALKIIIIYMVSMKGRLLPIERLRSEFHLCEQEGSAEANRLFA